MSLPESAPEGKTIPQDVPILLHHWEDMIVRSQKYTPIPAGFTPSKRPIGQYLKYGFLNVDKPARPSSHEITAWTKKFLKADNAGHAGTLDPGVTGTLIICLNNSTRLVKSQAEDGKEYICVIKLHGDTTLHDFEQACRKFIGRVFQKPPEVSGVKKKLRVRRVYELEILEFDAESNTSILRVKCEAGTYIRTLCEHIGVVLGIGAHMLELRRSRTGQVTEFHNSVTMHEVLDAAYLWKEHGDDSYLKAIVNPVECLLVKKKRIIMKDTAVNAITYGAKIMLPGVLRFDDSIEVGEEIVVITTKGEAICVAYAQMTSMQLATVEHGVAAKIRRMVMDRDTYPRRWGKGPHATEKQKMKAAGTLDKYGKPNDKTPAGWKEKNPDFSKEPTKIKVETNDIKINPEVILPKGMVITPPAKEGEAMEVEVKEENVESATESKKKKKKKDKKKKKKKKTEETTTKEAAVTAPPADTTSSKKKKKKKKKRKLEDGETPAAKKQKV